MWSNYSGPLLDSSLNETEVFSLLLGCLKLVKVVILEAILAALSVLSNEHLVIQIFHGGWVIGFL